MKVLYVSDLDGTLLNRNQKMDENAIKELNAIIDKGINFTVSTGRGDTVRTILKDVKLKLPIMMLNGAVNYDFKINKYINKRTISNEKAQEVIEAIKDLNYIKFEIQAIYNNQVNRISYDEWDKLSECLILHTLNKDEDMEKIENALNKIEGIDFFVNRKVYTPGETFCDVVCKGVSKGNSLLELKKTYGFDKIIAFGDSKNDLPLQEVADEFYAVDNAEAIVKEKATGIIESCYDNGVVKFLSQIKTD